MDNAVQMFVLIYEYVLDSELNFKKREIMQAIQTLLNTYKKIDSNYPISAINYNHGIYRFAYIYLYGVCHTATVREHVKIIEANASKAFREMFKLEERILNICSLGGGPGCEVIAILSIFGWIHRWRHRERQLINCTILDSYSGWSKSFAYLLDAFLSSSLWKNNGSRIIYRFLTTDLCSDLKNDVKTTIRNADLVTMVKFVSAISYYCQENPNHLKNIFRLMKSDSYLFFLDNCIGGFYEMVSEIAKENNLVLIFSHKTHYKIDQSLKFHKYKFSRYPFRSTSVIFAIWKKRKNNPCTCVCL